MFPANIPPRAERTPPPPMPCNPRQAGRSSPQFSGSGSPRSVRSPSLSSSPRLDPFYAPKVLRKNSAITRVESEASGESKVLVLYTGGTIGMTRAPKGYVPSYNMLERNIRSFPQLHDVNYSLRHFDDDAEGDEDGRSSTSSSSGEESMSRLMVLPDTGDNFRVIYTVFEYEPLLDSANMTMDDWIRIAKDIKQHYESFDGFVILHGTDTMAYTASALSFMLENLGKTVVITGSQIPLFEPRSDGRDNFLNSLIVAGNFNIPEVTVLFNNKLFRGNRTSKVSACSLDAFDSPNLAPLCRIGIKINVDWANVYRSPNIEKFSVHSSLNRNVGLLRLFPSITVEVVRAFLTPPVEGVVLQTYGAGNGPSHRKDLLDELRRASQRGVIIVNTTQCSSGKVENDYETGSALTDCGVVSGSDMTPEAALTKLSYVLSKSEWSLQTKRAMMQTNLRGELTVAKDVKLEDLDLITAVMKTMNLSSSEEIHALRDTLYPVILCTLASKGDLEKLDIMRQFGAYLSAYDYDFRTPLHVAASEGNLQVCQYLLEHGASVHMRDREFKTPLMNAIENDRHEVIRLLVKAGSYLNLPPAHLAELLHAAVRQGDVRRLESFSLGGLTLDEADGARRTSLHAAVETDQDRSLRFLLGHGCDATLKDLYGRTPKDCALQLGREHLVRILDGEVKVSKRNSVLLNGKTTPKKSSVHELESTIANGE